MTGNALRRGVNKLIGFPIRKKFEKLAVDLNNLLSLYEFESGICPRCLSDAEFCNDKCPYCGYEGYPIKREV